MRLLPPLPQLFFCQKFFNTSYFVTAWRKKYTLICVPWPTPRFIPYIISWLVLSGGAVLEPGCILSVCVMLMVNFAIYAAGIPRKCRHTNCPHLYCEPKKERDTWVCVTISVFTSAEGCRIGITVSPHRPSLKRESNCQCDLGDENLY